MKIHYEDHIEEGYDEDLEQTYSHVQEGENAGANEDYKQEKMPESSLRDTLYKSHYGNINLIEICFRWLNR